jgi:hypothetical protein
MGYTSAPHRQAAGQVGAGTAARLPRPGDRRRADRARPAAVSVQIDLRASEESDEDRGAPFHSSSIHYAYVRSRGSSGVGAAPAGLAPNRARARAALHAPPLHNAAPASTPPPEALPCAACVQLEQQVVSQPEGQQTHVRHQVSLLDRWARDHTGPLPPPNNKSAAAAAEEHAAARAQRRRERGTECAGRWQMAQQLSCLHCTAAPQEPLLPLAAVAHALVRVSQGGAVRAVRHRPGTGRGHQVGRGGAGRGGPGRGGG